MKYVQRIAGSRKYGTPWSGKMTGSYSGWAQNTVPDRDMNKFHSFGCKRGGAGYQLTEWNGQGASPNEGKQLCKRRS